MLQIYFETNLLLIVFWLCFKFINKIIDKFGWKFSWGSQLQTTRIVFLAVLLLPFIYRAIPVDFSENISPSIDFASVTFPDFSNFEIPDETMTRDVIPVASVPNEYGSGITEGAIGFSKVLLFAGCTVFLLLLLRLCLQIRNLASVIEQSYNWKKSGNLFINVSDEISVPFSTYLFGKAQIVIPQSIISDENHLPIIVAHEGQHLKNGDAFWEILLELCQLIFYWNPGIYFWKSNFVQLQELACDEAVLSTKNIDPASYSDCLMHVAEQIHFQQLVTVACNSMSGKLFFRRMYESQLERRLKMLVKENTDYQSRFRTGLSRVLITSSLVIFGLSILVSINTSTNGVINQALAQEQNSSSQIDDNSLSINDSSNDCIDPDLCISLEMVLFTLQVHPGREEMMTEVELQNNRTFQRMANLNSSLLDYMSFFSVVGAVEYIQSHTFLGRTLNVSEQGKFNTNIYFPRGWLAVDGIALAANSDELSMNFSTTMYKNFSTQEILAADDYGSLADSYKYTVNTDQILESGKVLIISTVTNNDFRSKFRDILTEDKDLILLVKASIIEQSQPSDQIAQQ